MASVSSCQAPHRQALAAVGSCSPSSFRCSTPEKKTTLLVSLPSRPASISTINSTNPEVASWPDSTLKSQEATLVRNSSTNLISYHIFTTCVFVQTMYILQYQSQIPAHSRSPDAIHLIVIFSFNLLAKYTWICNCLLFIAHNLFAKYTWI